MPGLLLRSPYKGTGKTTIGRAAGALLLGDPLRVRTMSWRGSVEFNKELGSKATECPFFLIDNVDCTGSARVGRRFSSDTICTAISNGSIESRVLGVSSIITIDRPIFVVTMQAGTIDHDLADRFLHVSMTARPPTAPTDDVAILLNNFWQPLRSDVFNLVMQTQPDERSPYPRYGDFFRHVAPVLRLLGLPPEALDMRGGHDARADVLELLQLLASCADYTTAEDLLRADHYAHKWPALAAVVPESDSPAARTLNLQALLRTLPAVYDGPEHRYALLTREGRGGKIEYRVTTEAKE